MSELTHASFFSGVGGLDLGLERARWRTVSFSEINAYASMVLSERWPGMPNLGDITKLPGHPLPDASSQAVLWSGGFPCQDLSIAGKRKGFTHDDGSSTRSGLAFAFLDLVGEHRPPAVLLENVPGLLSSHGGDDMAVLLQTLAELGYGVAYRLLDAQFFGVPQRRRRVVVLGLRSSRDDPDGHSSALRASAVLSVGARCGWHPPTGFQPVKAAGERPGGGPTVVGTFSAGAHPGSYNGQDAWTGHLIPVGASADASGNGTADGLARGMDDRRRLAPTLNANNSGGWRYDPDQAETLIVTHPKLAPTLRVGAVRPEDGGPGDTVPVIAAYMPHRTLQADGSVIEGFAKRGVSDALHGPTGNKEPLLVGVFGDPENDPLLPDGYDSHRYRCCGNGVVAHVATWVGQRLADYFRKSPDLGA